MPVETVKEPEKIWEMPARKAMAETLSYEKSDESEYVAPQKPNPQKRDKKKKKKPRWAHADDPEIELPKIEIIRS